MIEVKCDYDTFKVWGNLSVPRDIYFGLGYEDRIKNARFTPCIFHGIETIILLALFSIISPIFLYILIGFIFHQFLDLIHIEFYGFSLNHIGSQTYNILNYKKQKN